MVKWFKKLMVSRLQSEEFDTDHEELHKRIKQIEKDYLSHAQATRKRLNTNQGIQIYPVLDSWVHSELLSDPLISKYTHTFTENSTRLQLSFRDTPTVGYTITVNYV